jgi:hypothetical protein
MTFSQEKTTKIFNLITAVDFDFNRIVEADNDLTQATFTIWVEDKHDFKSTIDECLEIVIPVSDFEAFIKAGKYNTYKGQKKSENGRIYEAEIELAPALEYYNVFATTFECASIREDLIRSILKNMVQNVKG